MEFSSLLGSLKTCARPGCQTKFLPGDGRIDHCSDLCVVRSRQQKGNVDTRPNYVVPTPPRQKAKPKPSMKRGRPAGSVSALCPLGTKQTFITADLAWDFIEQTFPDDKVIHPYRCKCGAIHIGHNGHNPRLERSS